MGTGCVFSGKAALRLEPPPPGRQNYVNNTPSNAVRPGKYRLHAAIRKERASDQVYVQLDYYDPDSSKSYRRVLIGRDLPPGKWEYVEQGFEIRPHPASQPWQYGPLPSVHVGLVNGSDGRAWFDGVGIERIGD